MLGRRAWWRIRSGAKTWWWLLGAAVVLGEVAVLISLAGTGSRGGWVAWLGALAIWLCGLRAWREWRVAVIATGLRLTVALAAIGGLSVQERLDPGNWGQDRSVGNRVQLWQGATRMMLDRPWGGWGAGQSGWMYCEGYQPLEREELHRTCVNSYLTLGVERGLWVFLLLIGAAVAPLTWLFIGSVRRGAPVQNRGSRCLEWRLAAVASWSGWAIANVFSTLSEVPALWWWWPVVAVVAFWGLPWRQGIVVAGVAMGLAFGAAWAVADRAGDGGVDVQLQDGHWVFRASALEPLEQWLLLPDERVLGLVPGRETRRLALAKPGVAIWMPGAQAPFLDQGRRLDELRSPARHMTEGRPFEAVSWDRILQVGSAQMNEGRGMAERWRIHPLGRPSKDEAMVAGILLPTLAGTGDLYAWRKWAEAHDVPIIRTGVAGLDIRSRWPEVLANAELDEVKP